MTEQFSAPGRATPEHGSRAEIGALVGAGSLDPGYRTLREDRINAFIAAYPQLERWLSEPLSTRLGRLPGERRTAMTSSVNYHARGYLIHLGLLGKLSLDHEWMLSVPYLSVWEQAEQLGADDLLEAERQLTETARQLGYNVRCARRDIRWMLARVALHTGKHALREFGDEDLAELEAAIIAYEQRDDLELLHGSLALFGRRRNFWRSRIYLSRTLLYHGGWSARAPRLRMGTRAAWPDTPPDMAAIVERYRAARKLVSRPTTMQNVDAGLRRFLGWLHMAHPEFRSFDDVDRDTITEYLTHLNEAVSDRTGHPLAPNTKRCLLQILWEFFRDTASWGWHGVPALPPMRPSDLPRSPIALPRFIPGTELERVTTAIRDLSCPYERAALLVARWCGARRGEIQRLELNCLDAYPDGTPRLRIPAGKTYRERIVPLNPEAADAIGEVQRLRARENDRPLVDGHTAKATRYLFVQHGKLMSLSRLFDTPLRTACAQAGLVTNTGRPTISSHRFRHTVGTQLAERGARLPTIMAVLGHRSATMSMVYAQISDQTVLHDYEAVLGPTATIAGPYAAEVRSGGLDAEAVEWLKTNFFKTELELGRCLRLPQEGPCECDLALNCSKFVTTGAYAPRLRSRRRIELELVEDAESRQWPREAERHRAVADRIESLLADLGEPLTDGSDGGGSNCLDCRAG